MKIALVYPFFSPIDYELQCALEEVGLDTWIISTNLPHFQYRNTAMKFKNPNYKTIKLKAHGAPVNGLNLYFPFPILSGLLQVLKELSPDIVHTTEHVSSPSFWCNFHKKNWKTVLLERAGAWDGIVPKFKLHSFLAKKYIIPRVDAFAALSSYAVDNLRLLGCDKDITLIPNPVDTTLFNVKIPWEERKNVILYVGRLIRLKKIELIINAMPSVRKKIPDAELWLVGDGEDRDYYHNLAANVNCIKFLGTKPRNELPYLYNQAKALVMLTDRKNTGITMAVQEAIACGVPIIGSDGLPFDETKDIYYFLSNLSVDSISDNIIICLLEGADYSRNARHIAEKTYSHKAIGIAYRNMLKMIS